MNRQVWQVLRAVVVGLALAGRAGAASAQAGDAVRTMEGPRRGAAPAPRAGAQAPVRPITVGAPVQGSLTADDPRYGQRGAFQAWRFEARAGQRYQVTLRSRDFDAYAFVARSVGGLTEEFVNDDDGAGDTDARLRFRSPTDQTYLIVAQALEAGRTGAYTLQVEALPELPPARPVAMTIGEAKEGTLDDASPMLEDGGTEYRHQVFTFRGTGQRVRVTMRSGAFDAFLRVRKVTAAGEEEVGNDDDSGGGPDAMLVFAANGEYRVYARALEAERSGAFTLSVTEVVSKPVTSRPVTLGQPVDGTLTTDDPELDDGRRFHQYALTGRPGERFTVTLRSSDFDAFVDFGSVSGGVFESSESDDDGAGGTDAQLNVTMPAEGTWVIRVHGLERGKLGSYRLTVERRASK